MVVLPNYQGMTTPLQNGFFLGSSLIMAIGAQNAFVLRQGLSGAYVGLTAGVCILCDSFLICLGLFGLGTIIEKFPLLVQVMRFGAVAFLSAYGMFALRRVFQSRSLNVDIGSSVVNRQRVIMLVLGFSLLNPHVYLDTVLLIGTAGLKYQGVEKSLFGVGAILASVTWFCTLAFGAKLASRALNRPTTWRVIDGSTGFAMLLLAYLTLPA